MNASAYRRTGADLPFTDPRRAHGVGMEGYYWRFTEPGGAWSVAVMAGVCAAPDGTWAMVTLAAEPGGFVRSADVAVATPHPARLGVAAEPALRADAGGLTVDLGPGARLQARFSARRDWPRRRWGPLGPAQAVPGIGQYWYPHLLGAEVTGWAELGGGGADPAEPGGVLTAAGAGRIPSPRAVRRDLSHASVYAEKNWGAHFAHRWWWGQAPFGDDAGVAFAGGRLARAGLRVAPTAFVAWTRDELVSLAPPFARTAVAADGRAWRIRASGAGVHAELEGAVTGAGLTLPVPVVAERRTIPRSTQHLLGHVGLTVRRGRRAWLAGSSDAAALELGVEP